MFKKIAKVVFIVIIGYIVFLTALIYLRNKLIVFPTLNTDRYPSLKRLVIEDYCDPIPCPNFYLIWPEEKSLEQDFTYCETDSISGNRFLFGKNRGRVTNLGKQFDQCHNNKVIRCRKKQKMLTLHIYSLLLLPEKEENFYYCSN